MCLRKNGGEGGGQSGGKTGEREEDVMISLEQNL